MGSRDVTGIGAASVIHQMATQQVPAKTACACEDIPTGMGINKIMINSKGPRTSPILFFKELLSFAVLM
jgi:hypothetical protein